MKSNKKNINIQWKSILISGLICSLLPLLSDISSILVLLSFATNIPILYIGIKYEVSHSIISSIIAIFITSIVTIKENTIMFILFNIFPSIIIIFYGKYKKYNNTQVIIINLTLYVYL